MFSCEICEIFNNTYFDEHLQTTVKCTHSVWLVNRKETLDSLSNPLDLMTITSSGNGSIETKRIGNFQTPPLDDVMIRYTT